MISQEKFHFNVSVLQAIGPELTFYNTSKDVKSPVLSNKLLHAQLDAYGRSMASPENIVRAEI